MTRIEEEKRVVGKMVSLYCRKQHGTKTLCPDCRRLLDYAEARLSHCPFGEQKTACKHCPIHCYRRDMREEMQKVMRYAGPRMLFHAPLATLRHLFQDLFHTKSKRTRT